MQITGTIKKAEIIDFGEYRCIGGFIYGDIHNRWPDVTWIRSSYIVEQDKDIVKTLNSVYRVEMREDANE